ncbi:MAG: HNH endonuclease [Smithella sp.]|jgi:hypothetical protein
MELQNLYAKCLYCKKIFKTIKWDIDHGKAKFCSRKCTDKGKIRLPNSGQFKKGQLVGNKHYHWKGGIIKTNGYFYVYMPTHPSCECKGYVRRSRLVMENHLKRLLDDEEIIHHINHNIEDDRIENLQLFKNHSEHMKYHAKHDKYYGNHKKPIHSISSQEP